MPGHTCATLPEPSVGNWPPQHLHPGLTSHFLLPFHLPTPAYSFPLPPPVPAAVCERVTGEEEIPDGVVAVLTPDAPDVLSHVSVRARNLKTLFATCYESSPMEALQQLQDKFLAIKVRAGGRGASKG